MKKSACLLITLFLFYLLSAEFVNFNHLQFPNKEHFTVENYDRPHITIFHKDLIVEMYENNEKEIIYENPQRITSIENTRDTILRLHFNDDYPNFLILNENYIFYGIDANWINPTTAEILIPAGIYKIYTAFHIESQLKMVIHYDVDLLTMGATFYDIWIEHNEATNILDLNGCDIIGEPFDMSETYRANFMFHLLNEDFYIIFGTFNNQMITSDFLEDLNFVAGELKFDEDNVYITQYGPIQEITSSLSFSNEPTDYCLQQIILNVPELNEDLKICISNTNWGLSLGVPAYFGALGTNEALECSEEEWSTVLYMMDHTYYQCGSTLMIFLGYFEYGFWETVYCVAPFYCREQAIGSFFNRPETSIDYFSPDGETLEFGNYPSFLLIFYILYEGIFYCNPWILCYSNEEMILNYYNVLCSLYDSAHNLIVEGNFADLFMTPLPPDIYSLEIIDENLHLAGLQGFSQLNTTFDLTQSYSNPPTITSLKILNMEGKPVHRLNYNESGTVVFSAADHEIIDFSWVYNPVMADSTKAWYKLHDTNIWMPLDVEQIDEIAFFNWCTGNVFSADLSELSQIDSVAYDLRFYFEDCDENTCEWILEPAFVVGNFDATSISNEEIQNENLIDIELFSNFPNPFNPETLISFNIEKANDIKLEIYNMKGQKVITLANKRYIAGYHSIAWDGKNNSGNPISSGIYLYKLKAGDFQRVKKMILLK